MSVFDDWVDQSRAWHRDIRVIPDPEVVLCTKFADAVEPEIAFGRYAGERRWESLADVPSQEIKDELLKLIVSQADSEVRAVEQARELLDSAPTEHDRRRLARHITEETRHGWQMAYLLVTYFGEDGRTAALELLERRATRGEAQLEMFNIKLNWVDVFSWHNWGDRVGKYQLTMFGGCAFAPFARSIAPMLKEEGFHLVIGHQGLQRIAAADRVPVELHQRYLNRMMWICYDAFGGAESRRAARIHDWGLKAPWVPGVEPLRANERARAAFIEEVRKLLRLIDPRLKLPDPKGAKENLPTAADEAALKAILGSPGWIAPAQ
jgi:1,2-phenylacetyl-CoA epoxidase catalytic subunit